MRKDFWKVCLLGVFLLQLAIAISGAIPARSGKTASIQYIPAQPSIDTPTASLLPDLPNLAETGVLTVTATLIPLPSITFQFPQSTQTASLLSLERAPGSPPLEKGGIRPARLKLARLWPLGLLLIIWLVIASWYVLSQRF